MKISLALTAAIATLAVSASLATAGECTTATLNGHYSYWSQGFDDEGKPYGEVGHEHYYGKGNIKNVSSVSGDPAVTEETGTYTLNDNCTGTAVFASGATYNFFVAPTGDSFVFSTTEAGAVKVGENTRVAAE